MPETYTCPVCRATIEGDLIAFLKHTREEMVEILKQKYPEWNVVGFEIRDFLVSGILDKARELQLPNLHAVLANANTHFGLNPTHRYGQLMPIDIISVMIIMLVCCL